MDIIETVFGEGRDLNVPQMVSRGIAIFLITLILLRISGRRSFGLRHPLDNIIAITLGSLLSRAVVGVSPFIPVVCSCLAIVVLHRAISWLMVNNPGIARKIQGEKILLYEKDDFIDENMKRALAGKEDVMESVRQASHTEELDNVQTAYMERNGRITIINKPTEH